MTEERMGQLTLQLRRTYSELQRLLCRREGIAVERSADPSDDAQSAHEREMKIRSLDHESEMLSEIRSALQRMHDRTYGFCHSCEVEISERRLAALPWAKYCIVCQEERDR